MTHEALRIAEELPQRELDGPVTGARLTTLAETKILAEAVIKLEKAVRMIQRANVEASSEDEAYEAIEGICRDALA